ncbi:MULTISPECIES: tail fiber assembly protein [Serratia]|uniref:Caudovirales tail fibre assembly protein n=1 Tax=Serratia quinivorans TaxID=137545 RepID=A0A379YD93_9GAMM|nr:MULTISPECIES: tail fiber assembly protein [Serratia]RYM58184.1 hypothetical protein BSR03_22135 [Serratia proteamaculans]CAI1716465.1 Caudovirales tail fibre assembly protein [Serratia quinivorans]SUI43876.1 Caudovirales tail fibre assembly protein [Serratia quinivorans]
MNKIIHVSFPVYANAEGTVINCMVLHVDFGDIPFTASPDDTFTDYGPDIYNRAVAGEFGDVAAYVPPPAPTRAKTTEKNTLEYTRRLGIATDAAFPLQSAVDLGIASEEQKQTLAEWQQYAVDLLAVDLTQSPVTWPTPLAALSLQEDA